MPDPAGAPAPMPWKVLKKGRIRDDRRVLLSMSTVVIEQGRFHPDFLPHRELEVSCVEEGRGTYLVEVRTLEMGPGDVFLFNDIERHAIHWADPERTLVNRVVMFDPRFIWSDASELFDSRYLSIFFHRGPGFSNRIDAAAPAAREIRRLLADMEREFADRQADYELMLKVRLLDVLVQLNRHFRDDRSAADPPAGRAQDLRTLGAALEHIDANYAEELRLADIAAAAHLNASYFSTFFKRHMGLGPMEYVARRRVSRAVELLCATDLQVAEIAFQCGFRNTTTFNDAFRRLDGRTPTEVRRGRPARGAEAPPPARNR